MQHFGRVAMDQQLAQTATQDQDRRLRAIIDALPVLISYVDKCQRYQFNNTAYAQWFGISTEAHRGLHLREVLGDAAYREIREHVEAALAGERRSFEAEIPYRSAGTRYVHGQYVPDRDEHGDVLGFYAVITDLSESRRAAKELRESEQRFRATFEQAAVGMAVVDEDGRWRRVNDKLCEILGYSRDELLGRNFQDITYPDDIELEVAQARQLAAGSIPSYSLEKRFVRANGRLVWANLTVSPVLSDSRTVAYYVAVIEDISSRKAAEEALRTEHEFRQRLIETAQVAILVLDTHGGIVHFNRFMEELTGYALADVQGKSWFHTFLPLRDQAWIKRLFQTAVRGSRTHGNVNAILTKDGEERWIEWYDAALTSSDGQVTHLLCTGHDITERRELQDQLLTIAEQEQVRIGQDLHDDVGQEMTALGLTAVTLADALKEQERPESDWASRIAGGIERTLHKLQVLSRGLIPVEVDVRGLMSALAELAARTTELCGIACAFHCKSPVTIADNRTATQLYRIAQEAVNNAVRHSKARQIDIMLGTKDKVTTLTVRDDGIGIPAQQDYRGMGLRTMRYRAEAIGATLDIHSGPECGSQIICSIMQGGNRGRY